MSLAFGGVPSEPQPSSPSSVSSEADADSLPQQRVNKTKTLKINLDLALYRARTARQKAQRIRLHDQRVEVLRQAEDTLYRCIAMDPSDGRAYVSLGRLYVQQRRYAEADKVYEDGSAATSGSNAYIWTAWANLAAKKGDVARARKLFDAATVADDRHAAAWHGWGLLEKRQGNFLRARDLWMRGVQNTRRNPNPYLYQSLAVLAAELGRTEEARTWFDAGTRTPMGSSSHALWQAWALLEARSGDKGVVRSLFRKGLHASPRSRYIHLSWALWEKEQGNIQGALKLLSKGHKLNKEDPAILQAWGLIEEQSGNIPRARDLFAKGAEAEPQHLYIWQAWGVMEFRAGNLDRARHLFQRGVWADPGSRDVALVFQAWAVLERSAGNYNAARELFKCAVKADPKSTPSWLAWASMEEELGLYFSARELRNYNLQAQVELVLPEKLLGDPGQQEAKAGVVDTLARWFSSFGSRSSPGVERPRTLPTLREMGVRDGLQLTDEFIDKWAEGPGPRNGGEEEAAARAAAREAAAAARADAEAAAAERAAADKRRQEEEELQQVVVVSALASDSRRE